MIFVLIKKTKQTINAIFDKRSINGINVAGKTSKLDNV